MSVADEAAAVLIVDATVRVDSALGVGVDGKPGVVGVLLDDVEGASVCVPTTVTELALLLLVSDMSNRPEMWVLIHVASTITSRSTVITLRSVEAVAPRPLYLLCV